MPSKVRIKLIFIVRRIRVRGKCRRRPPIAPDERSRHHVRVSAIRQVLFACLCMAAALPARATPLFEADEVIEVQLIGPLNSVIRARESRQEYPFVLRAGGQEMDIDVHLRGKSRVKLCRFPPLRLDFRRSGSGRGPFAGQDRLKLVTHCSGRRDGEQNVLEEYLAYRIFGRLSGVGHRVRLLRIEYVDTEGRVNTGDEPRYGFVIEPLEQLAERVGGVPVDLPGIALRQLDPDHTALVYVFQYLIGNTDWSFVTAEGEEACCHNGRLVERDALLYYVPYDFDLSGIVNARYAKPRSELRIRSVRQRLYRGFCTDREVLRTAIRQVNAQRDDILGIVRATPGLGAKGAQKSVDYLTDYFEAAADEEDLLRLFERDCLDN